MSNIMLTLRTLLIVGLIPFTAIAGENPASAAVNHLGLALLRQSEGNTLISPWSLQQSLAMVYAGAQGKTKDEMTAALGYGGDATALHEGFKHLRMAGNALVSVVEGVTPLRTANRLFITEDILNESWLDLTKKFYDAAPQTINFSNPPVATKIINDWVSTQTNKKIPTVIPDGGLTPQAKLVIVNALYFDMPWDELFTHELTKSAPFFLSTGGSKEVPLMFKQHRQRYAQKEGYQIASLPYAGGDLQFVVILPDEAHDLAKIEKAITPQVLAECTSLPKTEVRLWLPRLKMEPPSTPMKAALQKLGMKAAFSDKEGDLSGIWAGGGFMYPVIDEVFHRTFIELDENGTKAAASTAVIIRPRNGVPHEVPHVNVRCDHPFIFAIQHVPTGACLFVGRVTDPVPGIKESKHTAKAKK